MLCLSICCLYLPQGVSYVRMYICSVGSYKILHASLPPEVLIFLGVLFVGVRHHAFDVTGLLLGLRFFAWFVHFPFLPSATCHLPSLQQHRTFSFSHTQTHHNGVSTSSWYLGLEVLSQSSCFQRQNRRLQWLAMLFSENPGMQGPPSESYVDLSAKTYF